MTTQLNFGRDQQGYNAFAPLFSQDKYSATLAATTDTTLTVPPNSENWIAYFSVEAGKNVWVALNATAAAPAGSTLVSSTSELIPNVSQYQIGRKVIAGDVLHFFSQSGTANISVSFYAISQ
jgi:hypothetical protein